MASDRYLACASGLSRISQPNFRPCSSCTCTWEAKITIAQLLVPVSMPSRWECTRRVSSYLMPEESYIRREWSAFGQKLQGPVTAQCISFVPYLVVPYRPPWTSPVTLDIKNRIEMQMA